jgi:hypothetical protein
MESFAPTAGTALRIQDVAAPPSKQPVIDVQPPQQPPVDDAPVPELSKPDKKSKDKAPKPPKPPREHSGVGGAIFVACLFACVIAGLLVYAYLQTN